jgi:hypothetical protein
MLLPHRGGATIDSQHSFIAAYKSAPMPSNDSASATAAAAVALSHADHGHALSLHTDDAEVTLNVCIGRDFQGTIKTHHTVRVSLYQAKNLPHFTHTLPSLSLLFAGGDLYFYGHPPAGATSAAVPREQRPVALVSHRVGRALLHAGGNRHGARPITAGERSNLIVRTNTVPTMLYMMVLFSRGGGLCVYAQIWCRSSQLRSAAVATEESDSEAP